MSGSCGVNPDFSPAFYYNGRYGTACFVTLCRSPSAYRRGYACVVFGRKPRSLSHLRRFATKAGEMSGLTWKEQFVARLVGRAVLVGIGDRERGDDGAGPAVLDAVRGKTDLTLIDTGSYPQNFMGAIAKADPRTIVLIDAAELGLEPGGVRLLGRDDVEDVGGSCHGFPLTLLMQHLATPSRADVFLLGIQIGGLSAGQGLTPPVAKAVREIAQALMESRPVQPR